MSTPDTAAGRAPADAPGRYLYAIVTGRTPDEVDAALAEIDDVTGLDGAPVERVEESGLVAITSPHAGGRIRPRRTSLAAHHRVLQAVNAAPAVLPVGFGVVVDDEPTLRGLLREHADALGEQAALVHGRVEMGVRLAWEAEDFFATFVARHPELAELRDRLAASAGGDLRNAQMELGRAFDRIRGQEREAAEARLRAVLEEASVRVQANPAAEDHVACDLSCLVERDGVEAFEAAVERAATRFDESFVIDLRGPWPPHGFVHLNLA